MGIFGNTGAGRGGGVRKPCGRPQKRCLVCVTLVHIAVIGWQKGEGVRSHPNLSDLIYEGSLMFSLPEILVSSQKIAFNKVLYVAVL